MFGHKMTNCHLCEEVGKDMGFKGGIWNTLHAGIAAPISKKVMFQGEFSAVMSGFKLAGENYVGGPPVIAVLGLSYSF